MCFINIDIQRVTKCVFLKGTILLIFSQFIIGTYRVVLVLLTSIIFDQAQTLEKSNFSSYKVFSFV